jgi:hypothetical protein
MTAQINALADRFLHETQYGAMPMSPELAADLRGIAMSVGDALRARNIPESTVNKVTDCYTQLPLGGILSCMD